MIMYIFQMFVTENHANAWVSVPPLTTNDPDKITEIIGESIHNGGVGLLWRILHDGYVIATNCERAFNTVNSLHD